MWVSKPALDATDRLTGTQVTWVDLGATTASGNATVNGAAYEQTFGALLVTTEAVAASDTFIGGFRYRSDGVLRVVDATAGVPAGSNTNQGIALSSDGQLCYVVGGSTKFDLNGVPVDAERRVYVAPLAFALEFADSGAGAVSTTEAITGATPTFTRATLAWTISSTGTWLEVASGTARSYYSPSGTYLGYLAEGARTNLVVQSQDFNTTWVAVGTPTFTADTTTLGALNLDTIGDDDGAALEGYTQVVTFTGNAVKAISIFVKKGTSTSSVIRLRDTTAGADRLLAAVTWTGEVPVVTMTTGTDLTGTPEQFGSSRVYRLSFATTSVTAANTNSLEVYPATDAALDVAGTGTILAGGVQAENATFASSYILTTTAAVTRNADVLTYPTTGWLSATAGTMYISFQKHGSVNGGAFAYQLDDGTTDEVIASYQGSATNVFMAVTDGAVLQVNSSVGTAFALNTQINFANAYAANDFAGCKDGGTVATDTSGTLPTVTILVVGNRSLADVSLFGPIRRVAYYSVRLANATLQAMTA